jgi:hypothetical protein
MLKTKLHGLSPRVNYTDRATSTHTTAKGGRNTSARETSPRKLENTRSMFAFEVKRTQAAEKSRPIFVVGGHAMCICITAVLSLFSLC